MGGKRVRPEQPEGRRIVGPDGRVVGEVGEGNRKDVRDAVEAAHAAAGWAQATGHLRAPILYYIAQNLPPPQAGFAARLPPLTPRGARPRGPPGRIPLPP